MKLFVICLFNVMFVFSGFICAKNTGESDNSPLPKTRPNDLVITYHVDGGMLYYSENLYLSADSCWYKVNDGGAVSKTDFKLSSEQLDKLYKVFRENNLDEIETYTQQVYDRGGEGIALYWGSGKNCGLSSSGTTFVDKEWHQEWRSCVEAVTKLIAEEIPRHKSDYEIRLDKSLFDKEIYLQVNRDVVIHKSLLMSESGQDGFIARNIKLSPGKHRLSMNIGKKYELVNLNADSSIGVILYLQNDSLRHQYITRR